MPESDTTSPTSGRVTDVDGHEVDDTTLNWLAFIALHMEEERAFDDADLLDDVLLALGHRGEGERQEKGGVRTPHRIAFRATLDRLGAAGLIEEPTEGPLRYKLTTAVVNDLEVVTNRIGTVWSDIGADAIDSKAELGWLVVLALRIEDRSHLSGDKLEQRLASLLGDRSDDARHRALNTLLAELEDHGYIKERGIEKIEEKEGDGDGEDKGLLRKVTEGAQKAVEKAADVVEKAVDVVKEAARGEGWELTDRGWSGGPDSLRNSLLSDFGESLLFDETTPLPSARRMDVAEDAPETDEGDTPAAQPSRDPEASRRRGKRGRRAERSEGQGEPATHVAEADDPSPHGVVVVPNIELCKTVLALFMEQPERPLSEKEIADKVADQLKISDDYRKRSLPPWFFNDKGALNNAKWLKHHNLKWLHRNDDKSAEAHEDETKGGGKEANDSDSRDGNKGIPGLYEYRLEHVFRALSIAQTGLLRDAGIDVGGDESESYWYLSVDKFGDIAASMAGDTMQMVITVTLAPSHTIGAAVRAYFEMHNYEGWRSETWMKDVFNKRLTQLEPTRKGGTRDIGPFMFELLIGDLLKKEDGMSAVEAQAPGSYLDEAGVDVVLTKQIKQERQALGALTGASTSSVLVQCKKYYKNEIPPDATAKLFATTMWLLSDPKYRDSVAGARLAFFGDLSREATWTFWALREAWDRMEAMVHGAGNSGPGERTRRTLAWEIWDGQKVFQLMQEHQVGVKVSAMVGGDAVTVDEEYFEGLKDKVRQMLADE